MLKEDIFILWIQISLMKKKNATITLHMKNALIVKFFQI